MSSDLIAGPILLLLGLGLLAVFVQRERRYRRLTREGLQASGTVRKSTASHSGDHGTVSFVDHRGQGHAVLFVSSPGHDGQTVTVCYDPDDPGRPVVLEARFNHALWLLGALVAGGAGANLTVQGALHALGG